MDAKKLETISNLFEGKEIRSIWDSEKEEYFFSVVDVIRALIGPKDPSDYWTTLKRRLINEEGSELPTNCRRLKMKAQDGKLRETDTLDTEGIFRLIESVPSKKAESFKLWLAKLGKERIDEIFDPEIAIQRAVSYYQKKGYSNAWIKARLIALFDRVELTSAWKKSGITKNFEFGILTNDIYEEWSGMTAKEYKAYKSLRKENLRDNMTSVELSLANLAEVATKELVKEKNPDGLEENRRVAKRGGNVAKVARENLEKVLGKSVISKENNLNYKYVKDKMEIVNKE